MHVVFLTSRFLPHSMGGGETHTYHLARALAARGHDVEILLAGDPPDPAARSYEFEGLRVTCCPADSDTRFHDSSYAAQAGSWLRKFHAEHPIDVMHVMVSGLCKGMMRAAVELRIRLVITLLDFHNWCPTALLRPNQQMCAGPESVRECQRCVLMPFARLSRLQPAWSRFPKSVRRALLALGPASLSPLESIWDDFEGRQRLFHDKLASYATFIAPSPIMRRLAEENGVPAHCIVDMAYGVPGSFLGAGRPKTPSDVLRVGFLGRLVHEKGVHVLVAAVRKLPADVRLQLVLHGAGSPDTPEYLRNVHAMAAGDPRIEFRAVIPQHEVARAHREFDVLAIPSLWHENATIALLESLALGTPAVVSDVEGMAPFVQNGENGFRVPPGDSAAFAQKLAWCAAHLQEVRDMSARCRPVITIDRQAQDVEATYRHVLEARGAPAVAAHDGAMAVV